MHSVASEVLGGHHQLLCHWLKNSGLLLPTEPLCSDDAEAFIRRASGIIHAALCIVQDISDQRWSQHWDWERETFEQKLCTDPTPWLHKSTLGIFCEGLRIEMHAALLARRLLPPLSARSLPCETPSRQIRFLQDPLLTRSHPRMTNNIFCRYSQGLLCSLSLRKPILCNKQVVWQFDGILYISPYCHILTF